MNIRKKFILLGVLALCLCSCESNLAEKVPNSFINETLNFELTGEVDLPQAGAGSLRGPEIENLVPLYATSYEKDTYLKEPIQQFRQWQWFDLYTTLDEKAKSEPKHLNTYRMQAEVYLINSKYSAALSALDHVLEIHHDDIYALGLSTYIKHFLGDRLQELARMKALRNVSNECADKLQNLMNEVDEMLYLEQGKGLESPKMEYDSIALLGCSPSPSGNITASGALRVKEAVKAAYLYPNSKIIISGGALDTDYTEAEVMANYLLENANDIAKSLGYDVEDSWTISSDRILLDTLARDTVGNAIGIFKHLEANDLHKTLIVASTSQIMRAYIIFNSYAKRKNYVVSFDTVGSGEVEGTNNEYYYSYVCAANAYGLFTLNDYQIYKGEK